MYYKDSIKSLATNLYNLSADMNGADYEEQKDTTISNLCISLERLLTSDKEEDKDLFECINTIVNY